MLGHAPVDRRRLRQPGPFKGNPACVVEPFDAWPDAAWMQALAAENNQAETAFLLNTDDPARFGLRWFTPALEVPLCGHATLAAAHVLFAELGSAADAVTFDTQSGPLVVERVWAAATRWTSRPRRPGASSRRRAWPKRWAPNPLRSGRAPIWWWFWPTRPPCAA